MREKLKFTVSYGRTINTGNYESEKYGITQEFYDGDCTIETAFKIVKRDLEHVILGGKQS